MGGLGGTGLHSVSAAQLPWHKSSSLSAVLPDALETEIETEKISFISCSHPPVSSCATIAGQHGESLLCQLSMTCPFWLYSGHEYPDSVHWHYTYLLFLKNYLQNQSRFFYSHHVSYLENDVNTSAAEVGFRQA